jgi:hypothetical protein
MRAFRLEFSFLSAIAVLAGIVIFAISRTPLLASQRCRIIGDNVQTAKKIMVLLGHKRLISVAGNS